MANVNINVNTEPLARGMDGVRTNVTLVGGAVAAMEAAVVATERKTADAICQSIDSGFYLLLRSRISARVAQFTSTMSSRAGSMMETASAIDHTHQQMRDDFNRIKARYVRLFDGLNRALEARIRALDAPAMELAAQRDTCLCERSCNDVPTVFYGVYDTAGVALKATNARIKERSSESIDQLSRGAQQIVGYARMTQSVFEPSNIGEGRGRGEYEFIPALYVAAENLAVSDSYSLEITPPSCLEPQTQAAVAQGVREQQAYLRGLSDAEMQMVRASYARKVAAAGLSDRVSNTMTSLFEASFGGGGGVG